ncbi:extensin family protein [Sphingomonas panacisoli]|nr:extensin family protein [Sphingomonas panacisoli]
MKRLAPLLGLLLAGCAFGGRESVPPTRPSGAPPVTLNLPTSRETQACYADLSREGVRYSPLPDRDYGGGCQVIGAVQLLDIGVPVTGIKAMRCGLAEQFIGWTRNAVAPAAFQMLGSQLVRVETMGTYACRNTVGTAVERLSGHALANAVDVSAFILADGRRISVKDSWRSDDADVQRFWKTIHASACKRFGTVLSPDYNAAHYDHLHLEDDRKNFCR